VRQRGLEVDGGLLPPAGAGPAQREERVRDAQVPGAVAVALAVEDEAAARAPERRERHLAEDAARSNAELMRAVVNGTTDAIFAKDHAGRYVMANDATALVALRTALAATISVAAVGLDFLIAAGGGIVVGLAVTFVVARVRRRLTDPLLDSGLSFVTPFAAYIAAEEIHASGVIAVVVAGLLLGHKAPILQTAQSRITERTNWSSIAFLLESAVFLLIGLQVRTIIDGVQDDSLGAGRIWAGCALILLAVLQGVAEFLPISSTAHLLLGARLLGFEDPGGLFTVMIQLGAVLAVMWLYRAKISAVVAGLASDGDARRFALAVVVAFIPAAIAGVLLADAVKSRLHRARVAMRAELAPALGRPAIAPTRGALCPDVLTLFSQHLEGEIDPSVCATMEAHLAQCHHCRDACESLKRTLAICRQLPTPDVPTSLAASVKTAIHAFLNQR